jgi:hypothetical protein
MGHINFSAVLTKKFSAVLTKIIKRYFVGDFLVPVPSF